MPRTALIQTNFTTGEISPRLFGRVDVSKYFNGCEQLKNMVVFPHGGACRRSGFRFVSEVKNSAKKTRVVSFQFSTTQAYILEFGDTYIRFYMNEGQILSGPSAYEITGTPYTENDLSRLYFTQSADVLYIFHPSYQTRTLSRTGHTSWTLATFETIDGPYLDINTTATTLTPSGTTGSVTITASAATFVSSDVGRWIRILHGTKWGAAKITGYTSSTQVTASVDADRAFGATTAQKSWRLGAWSASTGWPSCGTFHQERFTTGNTTSQPQTMWGSVSGDFTVFSPTLRDTAGNDVQTDDSSISYTLSSDQVNAIVWVSSGKGLSIGTTGGEFIMSASNQDEAITPTNVRVVRHTTYGSTYIDGIRVGNAVLFVQSAKRKIREFTYSFESDDFTAPDITLLSEHITRSGIVATAYAQEPNNVIWAALTDGTLLALTYQRDQQVVAWAKCPVGGSFGSGQAVVESIATINSPNGDHNQLWAVVKRTINGATKRYIEFMEEEFDPDNEDDKSDAFFVDSGLTYSGAAATTISGLTHLEGQTVQVLADGAVHPDRVVTSGSITLQLAATKVHVGLGYESILTTVGLEGGAAEGSSQGKVKRIHEAIFRFHNTLGAKYGRDTDKLDLILFRDGSMAMDSSPKLFTGDKIVAFNSGWHRDCKVTLVQSQPLPMTVLAIVAILVVNEG